MTTKKVELMAEEELENIVGGTYQTWPTSDGIGQFKIRNNVCLEAGVYHFNAEHTDDIISYTAAHDSNDPEVIKQVFADMKRLGYIF